MIAKRFDSFCVYHSFSQSFLKHETAQTQPRTGERLRLCYSRQNRSWPYDVVMNHYWTSRRRGISFWLKTVQKRCRILQKCTRFPMSLNFQKFSAAEPIKNLHLTDRPAGGPIRIPWTKRVSVSSVKAINQWSHLLRRLALRQAKIVKAFAHFQNWTRLHHRIAFQKMPDAQAIENLHAKLRSMFLAVDDAVTNKESRFYRQ